MSMDELLSRAMPHSPEAEQAVLGSMLIDADCVKDVMDKLQAQDFYLRTNREIFETIYSMFLYSKPIDGVTVAGEPKKAKAKGDEVARVESLPVHVLMETAMNRSNNSFTEIMGLQLAAHTGHPSTFAGAVDAIEEQLKPLDLWDKGTVLHDSSGLSRLNRVTTHMLARAVALVEDDQRQNRAKV